MMSSAGPMADEMPAEMDDYGASESRKEAYEEERSALRPRPPPCRRPRPPGAAPKLSAIAGKGGPSPRVGGPGGASPSQAGLEAVVFTHLKFSSPMDSGSRNRLQPVDSRRFYLETLRASRSP